jgi:hemoglobin
MKKDIESIDDIKVLIDHFYQQVIPDPVIGYIFTDAIKVNWEKHLPLIYKFWESILFYTGGYTGNPMVIHQGIHQIVHLTTDHFDRWITLFYSTVDQHFEGEKANLAKQRALSIANMMKVKILQSL